MGAQPERESVVVQACRKVLLEVMTILGSHREHIVIVGGFVPPLLTKRDDYVGTIDVDLALDHTRIPPRSYETIVAALLRADYEPDPEREFRFYRTVEMGQETVRIAVDLLAREYSGTSAEEWNQPIQGAQALKARGADLAFSDYREVVVRGALPDGVETELPMKIAGIVPYLTMKGMALWGRNKEKDAYDVYFCMRHYPGGIEALIEEIRKHSEAPLVREGLGRIRAKFLAVGDTGPVWTARTAMQGARDEMIERDAFELVNAVLGRAGVKPWMKVQ